MTRDFFRSKSPFKIREKNWKKLVDSKPFCISHDFPNSKSYFTSVKFFSSPFSPHCFLLLSASPRLFHSNSFFIHLTHFPPRSCPPFIFLFLLWFVLLAIDPPSTLPPFFPVPPISPSVPLPSQGTPRYGPTRLRCGSTTGNGGWGSGLFLVPRVPKPPIQPRNL